LVGESAAETRSSADAMLQHSNSHSRRDSIAEAEDGGRHKRGKSRGESSGADEAQGGQARAVWVRTQRLSMFKYTEKRCPCLVSVWRCECEAGLTGPRQPATAEQADSTQNKKAETTEKTPAKKTNLKEQKTWRLRIPCLSTRARSYATASPEDAVCREAFAVAVGANPAR
jgi:hypothetical protein